MNTKFPDILSNLGLQPEQSRELIERITADTASHEPVLSLKQRLKTSGITLAEDSLERALLLTAASELFPKLDSFPVHSSVKKLLRQEFESWAQPRRSGRLPLEAGSYAFSAASLMATGRRFPAGPMDWEISGLPRSWILKVSRTDLPRILALIVRSGGFRPFFFMHVAGRPRNRSLLLENEVLRSYYRIARSIEMQPHIKGLIAQAWFFDPVAVKDNPHLEFLQRPYLHGGLITTMGPADAGSGFAEHNPERLQQWKEGELKYKIGLALWPRAAAIEWAQANAHLEASA